MDRVKSLLKELDVVVILGALLLVAAIFRASTFYNLDNLFAILELSAVLGIATLGEALVLIVRGVDISVGAMMGLAGTLSAFLLPDYGMAAAVLLPLLACGLLGLANGLLIEKGRIPPIVAQNIALGSIFEVVPLFFVGLLVIGVVALFVRSNFSIGRYVYAVGGDEGAAYYSAIPVSRIRIAVYGVAGILYGIAGLLMASYVRSGMPAVGKGYEFKAITAAVLGGIALTGGRGNLLKAILGAVILIVLYGVVTAFAVSPYIQGIIQGCILVGAVYYATRHD
ncbi:MAG: ABC transporter permease [Rhizobiales bacterium]|nr:ABC transporter permease [Hyphomicrobiales bacterium]